VTQTVTRRTLPIACPAMSPAAQEREILERTVQAIADRAADAYRLVEEAHDADPRDESGLTAQAKRLRMRNSSRRRPSSSANSNESSSTANAAIAASTGSVSREENPVTGRMRNRHRMITSRS
jgi:hypothetical protein